MAAHPHIVFSGDGYDFFKEIHDPFPIIVGSNSAGRAHRKFLPVVLELERFIGDSAASGRFSISPDGYHCPVIADDFYADLMRPPDVFTNGVELSIAFRAFVERN